jgi:lipopolysaccharide assembly protein A
MQVVRTILWVLLAVVVVLFAVANWQPVEVRIGGGLVLETKLPVLVIGAFLLGLLPTWAIHRLAIWRLERQRAALAADSEAYSEAAPAPRSFAR